MRVFDIRLRDFCHFYPFQTAVMPAFSVTELFFSESKFIIFASFYRFRARQNTRRDRSEFLSVLIYLKIVKEDILLVLACAQPADDILIVYIRFQKRMQPLRADDPPAVPLQILYDILYRGIDRQCRSVHKFKRVPSVLLFKKRILYTLDHPLLLYVVFPFLYKFPGHRAFRNVHDCVKMQSVRIITPFPRSHILPNLLDKRVAQTSCFAKITALKAMTDSNPEYGTHALTAFSNATNKKDMLNIKITLILSLI